MAYSGRHRHKSRRERYEQSVRKWKLGFLFFFIGAIVWIFKERVYLWDWFQTYFY